ncbi:hypothetical protein FB45DRAFT_904115 [Roridomyces roridus]|uniref:DUF7704 domain-containing protein n=1 Tax=Roridomyces roridus TaxID=1738132 RepID=A0AAD7C4U1_9AGAR|nr:hypothetical protein FB45DRAFT_904115 [Roridomyces roridus]
MRPTSPLPAHYFVVFTIYEPLLTFLGFFGALLDPKGTYESQAPWLNGPPPEELQLATRLTITQLGHVCALLGLINIWLLTTARIHLNSQPALQEKIVGALLLPLLCGDVAHLVLSLYALGDQRWQYQNWSSMFIITFILGISLLIPRIMWVMGIGRWTARKQLQTKPAH